MRVLIADDEAPARERLRQMLAIYPDIEIAGEAATGVEAMEMSERSRTRFASTPRRPSRAPIRSS
jgi:DNA-binding NarL/FixJ family response regulator